jgi:hypothetical protein
MQAIKQRVDALPLEIRNITGVRSVPTRARNCVVERSVEEYSLDEPIGAPHGNETAAGRLSGTASPEALPDSRPDLHRWQPEDIQGICANPLRDEPHRAIVGAVQRFGIVGLVACALGAGLARWWKSLGR